MNFKIRCEAIKEFDPQKGAYVKCNREVDVDSSQIGKLISCPFCGNDLEVTNPSMLGMTDKTADQPEVDKKPETGDDGADDPIDLSAKKFNQPDEVPAVAEAEPVVDLVTQLPELQPVSEPVNNDAAVALPSIAPTGFTPTSTQPSDLTTELRKESYNDTGGHVIHQASFGRSNTCHKCGTLLEEKQPTCPNCHTARRAVYVDKKDRKPFSRKGPFGFHLWLDSITRNKNPEEFNGLTALSYAFAVILMGGGLAFFIFTGVLGKIIAPFVAFTGYALFVGLRYWGAARKNPRTRIPVLGKITWTFALFFVRTLKFPKVAKEKFLNKNADQEFGDRDLAEMKNLAQFKIVDLDGTNVSDEGLLYLYDHRGIQFVVLRNTQVTEEGAQDLQQTMPKTWIWY